MSTSYLDKVFSFFGINKDQEIKALPRNLSYYQINTHEINWAVKKIFNSRAKYVAKFGDDWIDGAVLHFIVMRLNYSKLHQLKPRPLSDYETHYFYDAAMQLRSELVKRWNKKQQG